VSDHASSKLDITRTEVGASAAGVERHIGVRAARAAMSAIR
jgi:hypothetical protein